MFGSNWKMVSKSQFLDSYRLNTGAAIVKNLENMTRHEGIIHQSFLHIITKSSSYPAWWMNKNKSEKLMWNTFSTTWLAQLCTYFHNPNGHNAWIHPQKKRKIPACPLHSIQENTSKCSWSQEKYDEASSNHVTLLLWNSNLPSGKKWPCLRMRNKEKQEKQ